MSQSEVAVKEKRDERGKEEGNAGSHLIFMEGAPGLFGAFKKRQN